MIVNFINTTHYKERRDYTEDGFSKRLIKRFGYVINVSIF
jgi:hypothetical protein